MVATYSGFQTCVPTLCNHAALCSLKLGIPAVVVVVAVAAAVAVAVAAAVAVAGVVVVVVVVVAKHPAEFRLICCCRRNPGINGIW